MTQDWQQELASAHSNVSDLLEAGLVSAAEADRLTKIGDRFRVRIPRYYASLIDTAAGSRCPIRKQCVPSLEEDNPKLPNWASQWSHRAFGRAEPWTHDAIGDLAKMAVPRLTHRYGNRAIMHVSSACAMYCRFCFRKSHLNASERTLYEGSLNAAVEYLARTPEIRELILTGGDPLSMTDAWLDRFLARLERETAISHVRIHSKMPVTLPSRLNDELATALSGRRFVISLVAHFNHPHELTRASLSGLSRLRRAGVPLYNQSVLLSGVNDSVSDLYDLFQTLFESGVSPYYLHHPDWTPGTFHFRLPIARGRAIIDELTGLLSGPALPTYVLDLPGGDGKVPLTGSSVREIESRVEGGFGGALHEVRLPMTREHRGQVRVFYAEFWRV